MKNPIIYLLYIDGGCDQEFTSYQAAVEAFTRTVRSLGHRAPASRGSPRRRVRLQGIPNPWRTG